MPLNKEIKQNKVNKFILNEFWIYPRAQSDGAAEYTDCISADVLDYSDECPVYDSKQFHAEASLILNFWGTRSIHSLPSLRDPF